MPDKKRLEQAMEAAAIVPAVVGVLSFLPSGALVANPLEFQQFVLIFLVPATIGILRAVVRAAKSQNDFFQALRGITSGLLIGISTGYGFLSLVIVFNWQQTPNIGHLEPLFVALGIAAAGAESARRLKMSDLSSFKNG